MKNFFKIITNLIMVIIHDLFSIFFIMLFVYKTELSIGLLSVIIALIN